MIFSQPALMTDASDYRVISSEMLWSPFSVYAAPEEQQDSISFAEVIPEQTGDCGGEMRCAGRIRDPVPVSDVVPEGPERSVSRLARDPSPLCAEEGSGDSFSEFPRELSAAAGSGNRDPGDVDPVYKGSPALPGTGRDVDRKTHV